MCKRKSTYHYRERRTIHHNTSSCKRKATKELPFIAMKCQYGNQGQTREDRKDHKEVSADLGLPFLGGKYEENKHVSCLQANAYGTDDSYQQVVW